MPPSSPPPPAPSPRAPGGDPEERAFRLRLGLALDTLGQVGLPATLGALGGFYAADQGMRLIPEFLGALSLAALVCAGLVLVGKALRGRAHHDTPQGTVVRRRVMAILVLGALAAGVRVAVFYTQQPAPLTELSVEDFDAAFAIDLQRYQDLEEQGDTLLRRLEDQPWLGPDAADHVLSAEEEAQLRQAWAELYAVTVQLDALRLYYEDWYRFDPSRVERERHLKSFLLTYACELALYEQAARLSALVLPNASTKRFLDTPVDALDLPKTSFSLYRQELLGTRDQARVIAGEQYLQALAMGTRGRQEARALGLGWLWAAVLGHLQTIDAVSPIDRTALMLRADAQVLKRTVKRVWYPAQKGIAEAMGDIRARRIGWYLIGEELQAEVMALSEPGDVMLSRKNWYLSNAGLPGFWPHAILYIGTPDELAAWADTDEVRAWVARESGVEQSFPAYMASRHPTTWARYQRGELTAEGDGADHESGHPYVVIEAISEGVVLNTMPHAAGDYLAVLRPRLDAAAKARAIDQAFGHLGKPYDFDFDFATDATLVCTELVWRSYRPITGEGGLEIPLVTLAGRVTLPANEVARVYAETADDPARPFDFVAFVDASERTRETWLSDEPTFRASHARSKLDVASQ